MPLTEMFISVFAPHHCLICFREGLLLCNACQSGEIVSPPPRCYKCLAATVDSMTCKKCRRKSPLGHVWVKSIYESTVADLLIRYKHERARSAYKPISGMMAESLPYLKKEVLLVAVPTATSSLRRRGYDHSALLMKGLASRIDRMWVSPAVRLGQSHQFGSSRAERLRQLEGAFLVDKPRLIQGKHVVIVDDVLTTGATLETFGYALKKAGAKKVSAVVFAQKL
jgi:ComF family protein